MIKRGFFVIHIVLLAFPAACNASATTSTTVEYSMYQLEYRLFAQYDVFWCDPDLYPVANPTKEMSDAIAEYPSIRANDAEFAAILDYLDMDLKDSYTDQEKLLIYRQHKKLTLAIQMTSDGEDFDFVLRTGEGQGWRYEGTVTTSGQISVKSKVTSFNTCPICLSEGTLIDTPNGPLPVEDLKVGMQVWTLDSSGVRMAAPIIRTVSTPVPASFQVVRITLADGRTVNASPGHPSADFKALGDYRVGDTLDGSQVVSVETIAYGYGATYDILPAGGTGLYWAGGILLMSTLAD